MHAAHRTMAAVVPHKSHIFCGLVVVLPNLARDPCTAYIYIKNMHSVGPLFGGDPTRNTLGGVQHESKECLANVRRVCPYHLISETVRARKVPFGLHTPNGPAKV